ncbi:MAG: aldo/keto reductase [Solirubrobacteraceae bacterium]|nr:aldo/keto reductase [Patulibacter sp.]
MTKTSFLGDQPVSQIGYGAMQLAGPGVFGPPRDKAEAIAVLRRAVELGVDHIDTAQFYGPDVVNDLIREALHPYADGLKLVTKVGARRDDKAAWLPADRPEELRDQVEQNLRSLGIEQIELVNIRLMDDQHPSDVPLADKVEAIKALVDEGKVRQIGISNASLEHVQEALALTPLGEIQNAYSVANRKDEAVLDLCREHGISYVPYFPLGSAFAGGPKALAADPVIAGVAEKHGVSASQIALAWLLAHYDRMLLIPGTSSVAHLEENLAVGDIALDADDLTQLEGATQLGDPMAAVQH